MNVLSSKMKAIHGLMPPPPLHSLNRKKKELTTIGREHECKQEKKKKKAKRLVRTSYPLGSVRGRLAPTIFVLFFPALGTPKKRKNTGVPLVNPTH